MSYSCSAAIPQSPPIFQGSVVSRSSTARSYTARERQLPEGLDQGLYFALDYEMEHAEPAGDGKEKLPPARIQRVADLGYGFHR